MYISEKRGRILSFVLALLLAVSVFVAVMLAFVLLTFDLGGGQAYEDRQVQNYILWVIIFTMSGVTFLMAYSKYKNSRPFVGYGLFMACALQILFMMYIVYSTLPGNIVFERYAWKQQHTLPMALYLHEENILNGFTPGQVSQLLGKPNDSYTGKEPEAEYMAYYIEHNSETWVLYIYFNAKHQVNQTIIKTAYLSV